MTYCQPAVLYLSVCVLVSSNSVLCDARLHTIVMQSVHRFMYLEPMLVTISKVPVVVFWLWNLLPDLVEP